MSRQLTTEESPVMITEGLSYGCITYSGECMKETSHCPTIVIYTLKNIFREYSIRLNHFRVWTMWQFHLFLLKYNLLLHI